MRPRGGIAYIAPMTRIVEEGQEPLGFSLLGGPLHRLGRRLGLVRGTTNTVAMGLALGVGAWTVLMALALVEGAGPRLFSLSMIAGHVRLLIVVPLFFLCESWVDPRMTAFVDTLRRSGVVPGKAMPALQSEIARNLRWKDSWLPEALCLLATVLWSTLGSQWAMHGATAAFDPARDSSGMSMAGRWYWFVCLPLFRFLGLRWIWRLVQWSRFLWRISRLELHLVPTHPDGTAGLGYLEVVHTHFLPLVLALSALQAAGLAEELVRGSMAFEAIYPTLAVVLFVDVALFLGPVFLFTPKLWACRVRALSDYMEFASNYVTDFDGKWLAPGAGRGELLLGTPDLQSLADLSNSMNVVRNMRVVPVNLGLLRDLAIVALLPFLPLLLLKYPIAELVQKFVARLTGL